MPTMALWGVAGLLLVYSVVHLLSVWANGSNLGQSSGIVIGQAMDLAEGVFYRPIFSERGYGGTRYMPLPFVILAPFIRMGFSPINVAYAATLLTDIALVGGVYVLLRRLGVEWKLAAPAAVLVLGAASSQYAATTVRGDLLPATLNVWGLAFALTAGKDLPKPRPAVAALFFTLAFTGKIVALYGVSAAVLAMLLHGQWKNAIKLTLLTWLGMGLALGIIHLASEGRFMENLRVCAAGGTSWEYIQRAWKVRLLRNGFGLDWIATGMFLLAGLAIFRVRWNQVRQVAALAIIAEIAVVLGWYVSLILAVAVFLLACAVVFRIEWEDLRQTPLLALLTTAAVIVGLFTSPGIGFNLLIDLHIIALVFVVVQVARGRVPTQAGVLVLAGVGLFAVYYLAAAKGDKGLTPERAATLVEAMGPKERGPFVCKPPMLHVYAGEAPYILDPWMFRMLARHDAKFCDKLNEDLRKKHFRAVVSSDLDEEGAEEGAAYQFGPGFAKALAENYEETAKLDRERYVIYRPKGEGR